jgi:sugar O-acyltransferase (sialic acid O-acetyltransferase NeuD family)
MLLTGAKGHAVEVLDIILKDFPIEKVWFFDNVSTEFSLSSIDPGRILRTNEELKKHFSSDPGFVLGTGVPSTRRLLEGICLAQGGKLESVISQSAIISSMNVKLGEGLNIMHGVIIHPEVAIGRGTLVNCRAVIHHECVIGDYCEISPGALLLGKVNIGDNTTVGSGAVVLPGKKIGRNVIIAAGAVVTTDIPDNTMAAGIPAKVKKNLLDNPSS